MLMIRYWFCLCVCVPICCYRLFSFFHFAVAHVNALDSNCQCGELVCFCARMYKHITRARRNFHFYWRHIKCTYYIMVHSFSIWISVLFYGFTIRINYCYYCIRLVRLSWNTILQTVSVIELIIKKNWKKRNK